MLARMAAVLLTVLSVLFAAPSPVSAAPSAATVAAYEARVIWRMNITRAGYRLGRLAPGTCPDRYVESWAAYLARTGRFYHQNLWPILGGCNASRVAENLARGAITPDQVVALWMGSPGHRANVLDGRLTRVGVAAVYSSGRWTVAANFTRGA